MVIKEGQSNIGEEIDTDVECEPVGRIPEEESKLRSSMTQGDVDRPTRELGASRNL